ncbi:Ubiquitin-conjugating enzyme E2 [Sesbania bispinosa]|nr:Ubiquitin-conjugating enzyme E2 [Sesbania bispinosa]
MEKRDFKQFDVVSDTSDHYFVRKNPRVGDCFSNSKRDAYKTIMREWKTLEEHLPESIYVRVYDRNIDLMRAVIIGAAGTPYHDALFFFDIAFPHDYPTHPPKVYYHSFGVRLNPNLYNNGTICLSLLNTWFGNDNERWDPTSSTVLQVLLSIQGLVLNERPFYNEPSNGTLRRFLPENKSNAYNEEVFSLTCSTTVHLIRKPPKHFEDFVRDHFRERAHDILSACDEYVNGRVRVGYYNCNISSMRRLGSSSRVKVTPDFEKWATDSYPKLIDTLQRFCGANVETPIIKTVELPKKPSERKKDNGIFKKAMAKIKQTFKWKNFGKKKKIISGTEESDDLRL